MSFEWPVDKLSTINAALSQCGDTTANVADDGSDEWNTASPAYERALGYMTESHGWSFATVVENINPSPTAPGDIEYDTAYPLPPDLVHLIWVRIFNGSQLPVPVLYDIVGGQLVLNAQGGPPPPASPVTPFPISIKYVSSTMADPTGATPTFVLALQAFVMAGIYRGLHEDAVEGDKMWQAGEMMLQRARTRYDQQKPKRQFWNSRIRMARRIRRPWPSHGNNNWGGTGSPGT